MKQLLGVWKLFLFLSLAIMLSNCGGGHTSRVIDSPATRELPGWQKPYEVDGQRYQPLSSHQGFQERGVASWYGSKFHGRKTSNGETYDMYGLSAAHKTLPMGVYVKVTHLKTGKQIIVRVNDRGPFVAGRIIDLSYGAAKQLGIVETGTAPVQLEALGYRQVVQGKTSYVAPTSYDAGSFAIQIGAFANADNAYKLASQMQAKYGKAVVATALVNERKLYRVRVGDYKSLHHAELAVADFVGRGFTGSFVVAFN